MVFCTYCGQSFTRDEHLERHILTHTNVKPFKCMTCHMSFARRDLLQRHFTVHGRDQNNQEGLPPNHGMHPKTAGRTPIACSNCAKTKTKCDKKFPCSRCASRNLKCTLRPTRRQSKHANRGQYIDEGTGAPTSVSATAVVPSKVQQVTTPEDSKSNSPQPSSSTTSQSTPLLQTSREPSPPRPPDEYHSPRIIQAALEPSQTMLFSMSPSNFPAAVNSVMLSPLPTPGIMPASTFMNTTPMSAMEEFSTRTSDGSDIAASPSFMMDWGQIQFTQIPPRFEDLGRADDHLLMPTTHITMGDTSEVIEPALFTIPGLINTLPEVENPRITSTRMNEVSSKPETQPPPIVYYGQHFEQAPVVRQGTTELPAVVAARDGWNCFKSSITIPSSACPRTASLHLSQLEQSLKNHESWMNWSPTLDDAGSVRDCLRIVPLLENTRDRLLAITQSFLHKAIETHHSGGSSVFPGQSPSLTTTSSFVLLPPSRVLELFLRAYGNSFERFFPLTPRGLLDCNDLLLNAYNDKASSLLVLLRIAQGAMAIPSMDARWLSGGLVEACRISLFDLIEKNISMASDYTVLQAALLFISLAAWSGDKWQMDIAMGQRGMYFAMLRHSGFLESNQLPTRHNHSPPSPEGLWSDWLQNESKSRLAHSCLMVDQDLSLFRDAAPLFSVTEFGVPMPDAESLWQAQTTTDWMDAFNSVHTFANGLPSVGSGIRPFSLRSLFRSFLDDEVLSKGIELTALHLRLLLHPLQGLVHQARQLLSCFSDHMGSQHKPKAVSAATARGQLQQMQALLKRWYGLADRYMTSNATCPMMQANLIIFHLNSLNIFSDFPEVERLARGEGFDGSYQQLLWIHKRCITDVEEVIFHAGQVLRHIRDMPKSSRPPWWAGAVYRVALLLWTDSLTHTESVSPANGLFPVPGPTFSVDTLCPDHPLVLRYLTKREGVPTLTNRDGSQLSLDNAVAVLHHCIELIDEGIATRFTDGIRSKLEKLATPSQ